MAVIQLMIQLIFIVICVLSDHSILDKLLFLTHELQHQHLLYWNARQQFIQNPFSAWVWLYLERAADAVHKWKHMEHSSGDDEDSIPLHTRLFTLRPKLCLYWTPFCIYLSNP